MGIDGGAEGLGGRQLQVGGHLGRYRTVLYRPGYCRRGRSGGSAKWRPTTKRGKIAGAEVKIYVQDNVHVNVHVALHADPRHEHTREEKEKSRRFAFRDARSSRPQAAGHLQLLTSRRPNRQYCTMETATTSIPPTGPRQLIATIAAGDQYWYGTVQHSTAQDSTLRGFKSSECFVEDFFCQLELSIRLTAARSDGRERASTMPWVALYAIGWEHER